MEPIERRANDDASSAAATSAGKTSFANYLWSLVVSLPGLRSQTALANYLDVKQPAVSQWLSGKTMPEPWRLALLIELASSQTNEPDLDVHMERALQNDHSNVYKAVRDDLLAPTRCAEANSVLAVARRAVRMNADFYRGVADANAILAPSHASEIEFVEALADLHQRPYWNGFLSQLEGFDSRQLSDACTGPMQAASPILIPTLIRSSESESGRSRAVGAFVSYLSRCHDFETSHADLHIGDLLTFVAVAYVSVELGQESIFRGRVRELFDKTSELCRNHAEITAHGIVLLLRSAVTGEVGAGAARCFLAEHEEPLAADAGGDALEVLRRVCLFQRSNEALQLIRLCQQLDALVRLKGFCEDFSLLDEAVRLLDEIARSPRRQIDVLVASEASRVIAEVVDVAVRRSAPLPESTRRLCRQVYLSTFAQSTQHPEHYTRALMLVSAWHLALPGEQRHYHADQVDGRRSPALQFLDALQDTARDAIREDVVPLVRSLLCEVERGQGVDSSAKRR
jgi:DNA-binding transcriptional regulator YdaS (Cro superfamily)